MFSMLRKILLLVIHALAVDTCSVSTQIPIQAASFNILNNAAYVPSQPYNTIANLTGASVNSIEKCARTCLANRMCMTATFYPAACRCLLYREKRGLGQLLNGSASAVSTIDLSGRTPPVVHCVKSNENIFLNNSKFIYSPNQRFAFGLAAPAWGIFHVNSIGRLLSLNWQPYPNISALSSHYFQLQGDGNVMLYTVGAAGVWSGGGYLGGAGAPYTFSISDVGKLVWVDRTGQIIRQQP